MPAAALQRRLEDDFVFTLSDQEEDISSDIERSDPKPAKNLKRKLGPSIDNGQAQKKRKGGKTSPNNQKVQDDELNGSETDESVGEGDGALDPDFEFEVQASAGFEVQEDFDAWVADGKTTNGVHDGGKKKALDIDQIIEKKREARLKTANGNGLEDASDLEETGDGSMEAESVEEVEQHADLAVDDTFGFDDEEALAPEEFGAGLLDPEESDIDNGSSEHSAADSGSDDESVASPTAHPDDLEVSSGSEASAEDPDEVIKRAAFFAPESEFEQPNQSQPEAGKASFSSFALSRPILKGVALLAFTVPTPIQQKTIPMALLGKDIVGSAVTGSGKTAAFLLPILERLLYRPRKIPTTRVAILLPTRELAVQCHAVALKLATYTDITLAQLVGGFSLRDQEALLKKRPDIVIATPGRFIDHMRNSPSFTLDTLEILVLDEADRMLDDGFADELNEILTTIPRSRQTLLFSATMTDSLTNLIRAGLRQPVRLTVDPPRSTVATLTQEFVRIRPGRENLRLAYLLALVTTVHTSRTIIFFAEKKTAHRTRVVFGLFGLRALELHGAMGQEARIKAVEGFRAGDADFLLATDVAARGLDVRGVQTVVNYDAPRGLEGYLHRVGRTARMGRRGVACTLVVEADRRVVKSVVKVAREGGARVVGRRVESDALEIWETKVADVAAAVEEVLQEEKEERQLSQVEREVATAGNLVEHREEIMSRPRRTWFESEIEKRKKAKRGQQSGDKGGEKKAKGKKKLSAKDKKRLDDRRERVEGGAGGMGRKKRRGEAAEVTKTRAKTGKGLKDRGGKKDSRKPAGKSMRGGGSQKKGGKTVRR